MLFTAAFILAGCVNPTYVEINVNKSAENTINGDSNSIGSEMNSDTKPETQVDQDGDIAVDPNAISTGVLGVAARALQ